MFDFEIKNELEIRDKNDQVFITIDSIDLRYSINHKGLIWDNKFKRIIKPYFSNKKLRYKLSLNEGYKEIELNKLYLMAFNPMHVIFKTYMEILKVNIYNPDIIFPKKDNLLWIIPENGVECKDISGYFSIVGNSSLVINKQYKFINYFTRKEVKITLPSKETRYPIINIKDKDSYPFSTRTVHRLVALAFIPIPKNRNSLYINHKNGIKTDYTVDNLEWNTFRDNNLHAIQNGLRTDNSPVIALNINTGQKRSFYSLQDASRNLDIHAWTISVSKKVFKETGYVKTNPWVFFDVEDKIPISFEKIKKKILSVGYNYFRITKLDSLEVNYLRGSRNLSKFFNTKVTDELIKENDTFELKGYLVEKITKAGLPTEILEGMRADWKNVGGKKQKNIRVTDLSNGIVTTYNSTDEFATLVGTKRKSIQHTANLQNGIWRNFKIEYLN